MKYFPDRLDFDVFALVTMNSFCFLQRNSLVVEYLLMNSSLFVPADCSNYFAALVSFVVEGEQVE